MPNMFLGFPVPRAKIAEMIEGYAPPLAHVARHRPPGDDPLALPADIAAGQLLGWDGTKYKGYTVGAGGIASVYDDPGINILEWFASIDGWTVAKSVGSAIVVNGNRLDIYIAPSLGGYGYVNKTPNIFVTAPSWAKKARWKADVYFEAPTPNKGLVWVVHGGPSTGQHVGFKIADGILYGSVGNGTTETLTGLIENWGSAGFTKTKTLEINYKVTSCDFYVDESLVATLSSGLPTGTSYANTLINFYVYVDGGENLYRLRSSFLKLWKEI